MQRLVRVRILAMLPSFFAAARMGVPASVLALTVVEWLATWKGVGTPMAISASLCYDMLWSAVALVSALSALGLCRCRTDRGARAATLRRGTADMSLRPAAFAIPGDITTLTGGYIYERRLIEELRAQGRDVMHLRLAASFPDPSPADMADAARQLEALPPYRPLILDGLVFGSVDTAALARVRAPVVAMIHHPLARESGLDPARAEHLYRTERDNLTLAAHVLVPSPHTRDLLISDYGVAPRRITIAQPGTERPASATAPVNPPLILSVGIQHPRKGHDLLLKALSQLVARDWQAAIVGAPWDPAHAAALARLHADLDLGDRVRLAGRVPNDTLALLYSQASIFALATRYEGYGIVFDEAMAHGLPIVTCRTGAVADTVAEGAALLVPPNDPDAFAAALDRFLTNAPLREAMAAASARAGLALPSWSETARIASAVLDRLVSLSAASGN